MSRGTLLRGVVTVAIAVLTPIEAAPHIDWRVIVGAIVAGLVVLRAFVDRSVSRDDIAAGLPIPN